MDEIDEKLNKKIDKCPFCDHIIINRHGKCPNCRKKLEEIFFGELYCPHCGKKSHLELGACSKCNEKITIPDFEYGKYIEIPKKRRINLVTEREEDFYQKLKEEHTGSSAGTKLEYIKKNAKTNKKIFTAIILSIVIVYLIFSLISLLTGMFEAPVNPNTLESKSFFMPVWIWFLIKLSIFMGLLFLSKKFPVYTYLTLFAIILLTFLLESLTFPVFPVVYIISQAISFIALLYGAALTLNYEDYLTHFNAST